MFTLTILLALLIARPSLACAPVEHSPQTYHRGLEIARTNHARRGHKDVAAPKKTAIKNVRVFDGHRILSPSTVFIENGVIVPFVLGADVVDGKGGVLLPGLIDGHTHPITVDHLESLASFGVTSTIVASCIPHAICASLVDHPGLTHVRFSGLSANAPNSTHALMLGLNAKQTITTPSQARQFVDDQLAVGATFIKIIAENPDSPTLDQATMNAVVASAHAKRLPVVCHAADYAAFDRALTSRADQAHHAPVDIPLDSRIIKRFLAQETVSVPTLSITRRFVQAGAAAPCAYPVANLTVTRLYDAGVPILAGTDTSDIPGFALPFGHSLHDELQLLVEAGMSTVDVLRSATVLAARHNLLHDRGAIAPGMRADLLLISGDPIRDISATRNIQRVWIAGREYADVAKSET
ncbi:hypothetical protein C8R43DRAFT_1090248 [Mycena crocata]|nr:hypothetical protein C8R43DRAFT_1090248 [Mycena crocata]